MSDSHGNTPAAWTGVAVALVGFTVAGLGLMTSPVNMVIFWIGMILIPAAFVLFVIMSKIGLGTH